MEADMTDPTLTHEVYGPDHAHPDGLARAKAAMDAADKARIKVENTALFRARTFIDLASDDLHRARHVVGLRAFYLGYALESMQRAVELLGYDLVKRDD